MEPYKALFLEKEKTLEEYKKDVAEIQKMIKVPTTIKKVKTGSLKGYIQITLKGKHELPFDKYQQIKKKFPGKEPRPTFASSNMIQLYVGMTNLHNWDD